MRVHHIIASINAEIGGPAISTTKLNQCLNRAGVSSCIHSIDYKRHGDLADPSAGPFVKAGWFTQVTRGWNLEFQANTRNQIQRSPGIIHNHGCWMAPNRFARQLAVELNLPLLVSPRGMLEPWSMNFRSNKKKWAWKLYEKYNLETAHAFHATSEAEANSIRELGFRQPIYLIPNGVDITKASPAIQPEVLQGISKPFVLFLSRIHPKKGIDLLLRSWQTLGSRFSEWTLVIAGPDLEGYRQTLPQKITDQSNVIWTGNVTGEAKDWLLTNASLLCLPTHSENFGIVVAEALAHGTPALTTNQTPWKDLPQRDCGWIIQPSQQELTNTLQQVLLIPDSRLADMGHQGKSWMQHSFAWSSIAKSMLTAYAHIANTGPKPACLLET